MRDEEKNYWKNKQQMANSGPIMDDLVFFFIPFYTFQIPYTERVFYKQ